MPGTSSRNEAFGFRGSALEYHVNSVNKCGLRKTMILLVTFVTHHAYVCLKPWSTLVIVLVEKYTLPLSKNHEIYRNNLFWSYYQQDNAHIFF